MASVPSASWIVDGRVYATEIIGDVVYVGGVFDKVTSPTGEVVHRDNLAAFRLSDGTLLSWRADANDSVRALESDGTSVWVGGFFTTIGGEDRTGLAKVDTVSGTVDTAFDAELDAEVHALDLVGGDLFIGGSFLTVGGGEHVRVAEVSSATGEVAPGFTASASGPVYAVVKNPTQDVLYIAGDFHTLSGVAREGLAGVDLTGAVSGPAFTGSHVPSLAVDVSADGETLYAGAGGAFNDVRAWGTSTGDRLWTKSVTASGDVQAVRVDGDRVYFGFHDGYPGIASVKVLAADAATGALDQSFQPVIDGFHGVFSIETSPAGLVIGGSDFSAVAGVAAGGWARFLSSTGTPPGSPASSPPSAESTVTAKAYATQVRKETNHQRSNRGLRRLRVDSCLQRQAVKLAATMAKADRFRSFSARRVRQACGLAMADANRAGGYRDGRAVVLNNWMTRTAPRLRVLDKDSRLTGVAARRTTAGRWYVVQIFGVKR